jgi:hypothetical protein
VHALALFRPAVTFPLAKALPDAAAITVNRVATTFFIEE